MEVVASRFEVYLVRLVLDQIRTVDKHRLVKRLGKIDEVAGHKVLATLGEMFAP
jgi:mRNA interferase MazF